eukprot:346864_1
MILSYLHLYLEWIVILILALHQNLPQDSVLNQYAIQSLYNPSNPQCIIKQEQQQQTPSTISTNSTISIKQEDIIIEQTKQPILMTLVPTTIPTLPSHYPTQTPIMIQPQIVPLISKVQMKQNHQNHQQHHHHHHHHHNQQLSPITVNHSPTMYTTNPIAPCLHTPEQMHFIHPLPQRVPQTHSPIIHHSTQQDIQETKQMLIMEQDMVDITMDHIHSSWQNQWKQWQEWQEFQELKQFKQYKQWRDSTGREYQQEMRILHQLVQIVQTFIIIICGMRMISCLQQQKQQYQIKINKTITDLKELIINYMNQSENHKKIILNHIQNNYIPQIIIQIKQQQ